MYKANVPEEESSFLGFGLSICKELMRGQNGNITLNSKIKEKGSRFILSLPKAQGILD